MKRNSKEAAIRNLQQAWKMAQTRFSNYGDKSPTVIATVKTMHGGILTSGNMLVSHPYPRNHEYYTFFSVVGLSVPLFL